MCWPLKVEFIWFCDWTKTNLHNFLGEQYRRKPDGGAAKPKKKGKDDLNDLKQELDIDDHKIPIEELYQRLGTNPETVSFCFKCTKLTQKFFWQKESGRGCRVHRHLTMARRDAQEGNGQNEHPDSCIGHFLGGGQTDLWLFFFLGPKYFLLSFNWGRSNQWRLLNWLGANVENGFSLRHSGRINGKRQPKWVA